MSGASSLRKDTQDLVVVGLAVHGVDYREAEFTLGEVLAVAFVLLVLELSCDRTFRRSTCVVCERFVSANDEIEENKPVNAQS